MTDFRKGRFKSPVTSSVPARNFSADEGLTKIAQANASRVCIILFFQEIAWLTLSRMFENSGWTFYYASEFKITIYAMLITISVFYMWGATFFCKLSSVLPRFKVGKGVVYVIFIFAIITNIASATFLSEGARYATGGLTGVAGVIYAVSRSLSLMAMVLALKGKYGGGYKIGVAILGAFSLSMFIAIDGLAGALTTVSFLFLIFRSKGWGNVILFTFFIIISIIIFYVGFNLKFKEIPYYLTPEFGLRWTVARMSISAESLYKYVSGESMFNDPGSYIEIIKRSYVNRYLVISGESFVPVYPRSVSEGVYLDMYGNIGSGSSPGFFLGLLMHGIFSPMILFVMCYLFVQIFYGICVVFSYMDIFAISLITKIIHANITEYIVFFSPSTLALLTFIFAGLIAPNTPSHMSVSSSVLTRGSK